MNAVAGERVGLPGHGTYARYNARPGCRCEPCRRADARYRKWRGFQRANGVPGRVSAVGTCRRLRGLALLGYGTSRLAVECGLSRSLVKDHLAGRLTLVRPETAGRVKAATRRLVLAPGGDLLAVERARREKWVPLAAWDDIDDPAAVPDLGPLVPRSVVIVGETAELIAMGLSREEIAVRLGVKWNSVLMAHARCGVSLKGAIV